MSNSSMAPMLAQRMAQSQAYWQTEAGRALWETQRACLGPLVEGRKGGHSLEMSMGPALMTMSAIPHMIRWAPTRALAVSSSSLVCPPGQLALPDRCIDTMVLHHWLEHVSDAHYTLQEAARVTADNGVLVLFGFNPISVSGITQRWRKKQAQFPWNGRWRSANRLRDWLAFVDLPLGEGYMIQAQRRQRHAPIQRVKFGLRAPVSSSTLGATRTGASARYQLSEQCRQKKDSERE